MIRLLVSCEWLRVGNKLVLLDVLERNELILLSVIDESLQVLPIVR